MPGRFAEKVVLVTGGTGGLGKAVSLAFLQEGANVAVTFRREQEFTDFQKAAGNANRLYGKQANLTSEDDVRVLTEELVAKYGRINVLVNSVGAYAGGTPLWELDPKTFDLMLDLNLRAGFLLARAIVPVMLKQRSGAIVNVASQAAVDHAAGAAAYVASKAAAVSMIDSLAGDLKGTGVRANSILPSIIDTEANRKAMPKADYAKWPKPEEIARVILFLASDEAKLVNGASVPV
jgi:NAD(P)-dependent dehydrogenase (short-subunit alcohol dehydrogenase family)